MFVGFLGFIFNVMIKLIIIGISVKLDMPVFLYLYLYGGCVVYVGEL